MIKVRSTLDFLPGLKFMAASAEISDGDHDAVELMVCLCDASASAPAPDEISGDDYLLRREWWRY
ncbi:unnamed protein product [Dovyalis caffra]|uniref:Uncharacterized protein n=1 Tax=Dovyalis caffra TaxID=77055 RepID=A0AAV1QRL4_9ROSI|nr:unnamed protein product [Dovyalis caffra]